MFSICEPVWTTADVYRQPPIASDISGCNPPWNMVNLQLPHAALSGTILRKYSGLQHTALAVCFGALQRTTGKEKTNIRSTRMHSKPHKSRETEDRRQRSTEVLQVDVNSSEGETSVLLYSLFPPHTHVYQNLNHVLQNFMDNSS